MSDSGPDQATEFMMEMPDMTMRIQIYVGEALLLDTGIVPIDDFNHRTDPIFFSRDFRAWAYNGFKFLPYLQVEPYWLADDSRLVFQIPDHPEEEG